MLQMDRVFEEEESILVHRSRCPIQHAHCGPRDHLFQQLHLLLCYIMYV